MGSVLLIMKGTLIRLSELQFKFSRSSGHGGQNVNKVETRVELLFDVTHSQSLTEEQREAVLNHASSRIDGKGVLHIVAQKSRNQWRNRQEAIERFIGLMQRALAPKKTRRATKATSVSKEKRLEAKKHRSKVINERRIRD